MPKQFIENTTAETLYVGGKMIPPGEGREIEVSALPGEYQSAEVASTVDAPVDLAALLDADLLELLEGNVERVTAALADLDTEALIRLAALEAERGHPRVTIQRAVEAERLRRASAVIDGQQAGAGGDLGQTAGDSDVATGATGDDGAAPGDVAGSAMVDAPSDSTGDATGVGSGDAG